MKEILCEIITIGDEILYGQITDTNSQWMSAELDKHGIKTIRKTSIGDNELHIIQAIKEAESRADIILITGGLGPTNDDVTKKTIAEYYGVPLVLNQEALQDVTVFFAMRGKELTEINRQQAYLPANAVFLSNKNGTAPGMWIENERCILVSMPGVPHEMKGLMEEEVIPRLKKKFTLPVIYHKFIKTIGIGESYLAEKIADWENQLPSNTKLAYLPSFGEVTLRLSTFGQDLNTLKESTQKEIEKIQAIIPEHIYGYDDDTIEQVIAQLLTERKLTIATAESCTGGFVAHRLTSVAGSSCYFWGSVIAYHNSIKMNILGVQEETLRTCGAVSEETVKEMAEGVRKLYKTDIGISTSGIAGPGGGTTEKPVGTIWIAYSDKEKTVTRKLSLGNVRDYNIRYTGYALLNLLRQTLTKNS
ncbi:MAG TPA: competence/damage-inducible protein A [Cytophagaceae bacterium]